MIQSLSLPLLNYRDVADTAGTPHRPLRRGCLTRAAQPVGLDATAAGELLGSGAVRTVLDLRSDPERADRDWAVLPGLGIRLVRPAPRPATLDPTSRHAGMSLGEIYVELLTGRTDWFADAVARIAEGLPTLVHCAAGKDRTGIVVALVLDLVGVERAAIVRDYTATAAAMPAVLASVGARGVDASGTPAADLPPHVFEAPAEAIGTLLDALAERGGAEALLTAAGLPRTAVQTLRSGLLADGRRPAHRHAVLPPDAPAPLDDRFQGFGCAHETREPNVGV